jgi:hypothetical protein
MNPPSRRRQLSRVRDAAARAWRTLRHEPVLAQPATAQQARRRRAHADAYDELLMKRLAERDEPGDGIEGVGGLPGEEDALIDTALYQAASWENARARRLVRRDQTLFAAIVAAAVIGCRMKRRTR